MNIGKTGSEGEKRVAEFLRRRGFSIIKRNYLCRYGEIDIIAENEEFLLFAPQCFIPRLFRATKLKLQ